MAEHLLDGAEVRSTLEEVGRERVAQEVGMHTLGLEAGALGQASKHEEGPGPRERAASGVEEELGSIATVEVGATEGEVSTYGLGSRTAERHEALLPALPENADDPLVESHARLVETDRLGDAETCPVQELHQCAVAEVARRGPDCGLDQPLRLTWR